MRFNKTFIIFIIAIILLNLSIVFATVTNNNNLSNFFRVHIVANSDSIEDQLLKYQIAKQVNEYIYNITASCASKQESKETIESKIQDILALCNNIITEQGYNYDVKAYIGNITYDKKQKDNMSMPAGIYDSLKIVIGKGFGTNWWSLIYPCSLQEDSIDHLDNNEINYSFYLIEWFEALFND